MADLGGLQMALSPAEFGKFTADEIDKWAKVIKFADIKVRIINRPSAFICWEETP